MEHTTRHARIIGTGRCVPEREITNDALRARLPAHREAIDKLEQATGILRRWACPDDWATSDLALPAARQALARAGRRAEELDLIVLGSDSPDYVTPATATVLQHKLGATNAGAFDVGCACASFPAGIAIAAGLVAANPGLRTVLVVGVYLMRRLADPADPISFLYGDGAGAAVLAVADRPGVIASAFQADGSYHRRWGTFAGGTAEPASAAALAAGRTQVRLLERYPPEINEAGWPRLVRRLASSGGFAVSDIDLAIFTQVRRPTIERVMVELGLPPERTHTIMERWGYTGSACVPMALDDAIEQGKARPGQLVTLVGSGVGYNQAGVALRL